MNYDPRYVYLYPASIPQIVAHIQEYLRDNPITSTAKITQMIITELSEHPEVLNGAEIPITAEDQQSIKDYIDHLPSVDGYTKEQVNALLDEKQDVLTFDQAPTPDSSNPVTSSGVSTAITTAITTLTALINLKANLSDVYTKSVIDQLLSGKANVSDVYTKTEANQLLAAKADETEVTDLKSALNNSEITVFGNDSPLDFTHQAGTILQNGTISSSSSSPGYAHYTSPIELTHDESVDKFNIKLNYGSAHEILLVYATYLADGTVSTQRVIIDNSSSGTSFEYSVPIVDASAKYVRFCLFTYNDSTLVIKRNGIMAKIEDNFNYLSNRPTYNIDFTHQAGTILQNGTISSSSSSPGYAHYTSPIELGGDLPSDTFKIKLNYGSSHYVYLIYATYLADGTVSTQRVIIDNRSSGTSFEYIVPVVDASAKYVRFCWFTYNDSTLVIYRDGAISKINESVNYLLNKPTYNVYFTHQSGTILQNGTLNSASTPPGYAHYTSLIELGGDSSSDTFRVKLKYGSVHEIWIAYATYLADGSVSSARIVIDNLVTDDDFEYIVAVSDANAKYVRFSWFTYNDSTLTIYRDGLLNRITELDNEKQEYNNLVSQSRYILSNTDTPPAIPALTLMHVSDVHGNINTMHKILDVKKMLSDKVSDILHTGDTTILNIEDGISNWVTSGCANSVLNVIGNHDAETEDSEGGRVPYGATQEQCYNLFFAPYISHWNVTQPTGVDNPNSADYCACYYYKNYEASKIRLVVLDCYHWTTAQLSWLESVLSDAISNQYSIIMASHVAAGNVTGIASNFTSTIYPDTISDERYYRGLDSSCLEALKDYEDNGGEIIVWLAGHTHFDRLGVIDDYGISVIDVEKCSASRNIDSARIVGETNEYSFNILSVDKTNKLLKIVRYGATTDGLMRGKHVLCFNYSTKAIISEW